MSSFASGQAFEKVGAVAVVGGGIGGMQAALDLAEAGFRVVLIEESPAIGGRMAQLDKTFPTNDCSMCTISPKLIEVGKHRNIELMTLAEVTGIEGEPRRFRLKVRKRPRYVELSKCNACGDCVQACPVELPSEFDEDLGTRKAIFKPYPQAIPGAMAISKTERPPCVLACPAGVNCQGYVALVAQGRFAEAYDLIRQRNPFVSACGRICHHPCEAQCNRRQLDESVGIMPLKRAVADWVATRRAEGHDPASPPRGEIDPRRPKVAVIGGGAAGLTAARDLALLGYPVTLFEANEKLGGTMLLGIPGYRLPEDCLQQDLADILAAGFEVKTGVRFGQDFTLESLQKEGYRAVLLAVGCTKPAVLTRSTDGSPMQGLDLDGVLLGLDFLREAKSPTPPRLFGKVVVIGGGNVAIDVAMTARRLGAGEVQLVCLEQREEMPAYPWEIEDAIEEGVKLTCGWGPKRFVGKNGRVHRIELQQCVRVYDDSGRFAPRFGSQLSSTEADWVIVAIGQRPDLSFLDSDSPLWDRDHRNLAIDPITLETPLPGVFAAGDLATGPRSVVEAVAQGHEAAESIDRYLRGEDLRLGRVVAPQKAASIPERRFEVRSRIRAARLPVGERTDFQEIEGTFSPEEARREAARCLACGLCSECMQCVKACSAGAVVHQMVPEEVTVEVGAVILAPGFEPFDPALRPEYGYGRCKNVITSLEFERILSASGPFQGHVVRPSDHQPPKRMAWLQCVGSRDAACGNPYCSSVCCMYAIKEAIMAVDHVPGLEATIFYNDIRAFGKGFEAYYERAKASGSIRFCRGIISTVKEQQRTKNLLISFMDPQGRIAEEEFDLVVLSVGLRPSPSAARLAEALGIDLTEHGFCKSDGLLPVSTGRPGIFVAGSFAAPMDIPETVMTASGAAAAAAELLAEVRGTRVSERVFPPERDVSKEPPRIGVFVCRCGTNIARTVGVSDLVEYARILPNVVYAEENLYTCSTDTQARICRIIEEHCLNRVVVASCTPRTHEPLFQETLREAGLNKHLFEMANIRDQCSWVHYDQPEKATQKAKDLVRMAVARASRLRPWPDIAVPIEQRALVLGGGVAGMTAALSLARQGFPVALLEREPALGGQARSLRRLLDGMDPQRFLAQLIDKISTHEKIKLFTGVELNELSGHVGQFRVKALGNGRAVEFTAGAIIVATGAQPHRPTQFGYGSDPRVITQMELEDRLADADFVSKLKSVVMIQCVGSRDPQHPYCSRVCCQQAVKNALAIKAINPDVSVVVLHRDMRTYGFQELAYSEAREKGVTFLRFEPPRLPEVQLGEKLRISVWETNLRRELVLSADCVVLSAGIEPAADASRISQLLKVPLGADGFFLEAHMKLRPLDFATEGIYLAGLAHGPKTLSEAVAQAKGAAARAATLLSKSVLYRSGVVSEVDSSRCAACLTCVRLCPYDVPQINEFGVAYIEPASCQGCGVCASACPRKAIVTRHYDDEQLLAKVEALYDPRGLTVLCSAR